MIYGQKKKINNEYVMQVIMDTEIKYRIKIDGVMYYDEYPTAEKAMEGAKVYFAKDHTLKEAVIIRYTSDHIGLSIFNKNYEEAAI